jgi:hypothetical protein
MAGIDYLLGIVAAPCGGRQSECVVKEQSAPRYADG